ncbi:MAG: hypothetical protein ACTSR3_08155 [Candidatus Helarchaeota archaeon]
MIGNVWIINKKSGSCLIHRNYGKLEKIDSNLFSGLLTAIINFSLEITGGDFVRSVAMGKNKFFYHLSDDFIIAVSMDEDFTEEDARPILQIILDSFISQGYAEQALINSDVFMLQPFEEEIDKMVQTIEESTIISQGSEGIVEKRKIPVKSEDTQIIQKKKEIEHAIENAEWAMAAANYKEAIGFFKIAGEGFNYLKEPDMAEWCFEMAGLTKMLWLKTLEESTQYISRPAQKITEQKSMENKVITDIKIKNKKRAISGSKKIQPLRIKTTTSELCKRLPYLQKHPGKKFKFPTPDSYIIPLCDGTRSIEEIAKITKINLLKVNEIIRKYQKKKLIKIKRVIK